MRKSKFKQTMSMLLAVLMVFMSMNFSVFAEELTAPTDETTTTTVEAPAEQPAEEQTPAVEAPAPVDEETGTTEENATDNSLQQEQPALLQAPVTNGVALAKIDDQEYTDQAAFLTAFNALTGAHTVQLLADVDLGTITTNNAEGHAAANDIFFVKQGVNITLDLNGHVITGNLASGNNYTVEEIIGNSGTLTIKDNSVDKNGKIENTAANPNICVPTIFNGKDATLTVEGGTIQSTKGNAITNYGKATINSGIIKTDSTATGGWDRGAAAINNCGTLIIEKKDGLSEPEISTNRGYPVWCGDSDTVGNAQISAGKFTTNHDMDIKIETGRFDTIVNVTGGTWDKDPTQYLKPGYLVKEDNNLFTVNQDPNSITKEVSTLAELKTALSNIGNEWAYLNMTGDITLSENLLIPEKVYLTIDSGKTFKVNNNSRLELKGFLENKGTLDISDIGSGWINNIDQYKNNGQITGLPMSENNVYKISTINQLQFLQYVMADGNGPFSGTIEIQNPIDAQGYKFRALGDNTNVFSGTFDGKGNEIKNITINAFKNSGSLFNRATDATFQNLNFTNCDVYTNGGYLGLLAGSASGTTTVKDSTLSGKLSAVNTFFGGGLFGAFDPAGTFSFENCAMDLDITAPYNVGTFWGSAEDSAVEVTIVNCSNSGDINATGGSYGTIGGWGYGNPLNVTVFGYDYTGKVTENGKVQDNPKYCTKSNTDQFITAVARAQKSDGSYQYFETLQGAANESAENSVIEIAPGTYNLESTLRIQKPLTLKGLGDVIITRGDTWEPTEGAATDRETGSLVLIENTVNATLENVTIQNAKTVTGSGLKAQGHGINIVDSQNIHLNNITTKNNAAAGLVVNSSEVFAHNLYTSDNGWYGINLDQNKDADGNPQGSTYFELAYDDGIKPEDAITDATQIYADHGRNESYSIDASLPAQFKRYNSGSEAFLWSTSEMGNGVYIEQSGKKVYYPTIQSAIDAAESGSTVYVGTGSFGTGTTNAPGTININKDITVEGQGKDQTLIADKMLITGNCKVKLSKIKIDIPLEGTADGFVAVQIGTQDSNSAQANVTIDQCVINQDKGGVDVSSKAVLIEKGGSGSILTIDASDITGSADRDTYLNLVRNNSDNSNITINNSNLKVKDENYECQYLNALVILGKNSTYNLNDSIIKASGFGISVNDGSDNIETGNKININHSTVESTGGRDTQGEIFYGGVAIDMYVGAHQTLNITNNSIIKAASITDGSVRAISFLSSKGSVTNIKDSTVYGGGYGIIAQSGSDNMSLNVENSSIVGSEIYGVELSTNTPVVKINNSIIQTNAGFSNSAAMFISQGAKVTVDKNSHLIAQNALGIYITASKDEGYKWGGKAGKVNLDFSGTINAKTGIVQSQFCGNGDKSDGPIEITLGPTAKIYALDNGFEFNSAYESTGAAAIKADKNAKVYAPVLVVKGENAVTDISQLDTLKFYAVSDVFTYDQETGAITLKEAAIENQTSGEKYLSIQEAIDNAYNNDRIYVPASEYSENIKLTKAVKLIGAKEGISANDAARDGTEETILKGSVTFDNTKTIRSTLIDGFTFTGSAYIHAEYWSGNLNKPKISNVVIQNNIFKDIDTTVSGKNNAAIHLNCGPGQEVDNVTIQNNQFKNITSSHAEGTEAAAYYTNCFSGNLIISNNAIDTTEGNAITITPEGGASGVEVSITNNTIKNWKNRAIRMDAVKGTININKNNMMPGEKTIAGPDTPQIIKITSSDAANAAYNYWGTENPTFKRNGENPSVISGDINPYPYYSASDMSEESLKNAPAIVYYKEGSEEKVRGMYGDIQEAVNAAETGDRIVISEGTHTLSTAVTIPAGKSLTLEGKEGTKPTLIAASTNGLISSGQNNIATTIKNLNFKTAKDGNWSIYYSGANAKMIVTDCVFDKAEGVNYAGNLIMEETGATSSFEFTDNTINLTTSRAALVGLGNNSIVKGNVFNYDADNTTDGRASVISLVADENSGVIEITDNIVKNANRFVAVDNAPKLHAEKLKLQENQIIDVRYGFELGSTANKDCGVYDLSKNYYATTQPDGTEIAAPMVIEDADISEGTHFDGARDYKGDQVNVYPYYIDKEMTKTYAPVEVQHIDGDKSTEYFGTIAKAYEAAHAGDAIVINKAQDGSDAVITENIDMNKVKADLKLMGSTTFRGTFAGSTLASMILQNGTTATFTNAELNAIQYFTSVDVENFNAGAPTQIVAPTANTSQNSFIAKGGLMDYVKGDPNSTWSYGSPSNRFNGGDGTAEKPWQINTPEQLMLLQTPEFETEGKYFKLTNDITVSDWTALAKFEGNCDGNGYTLTGNSVNFIDDLAKGAKVEKLRFEGFANLVNTNNGTVENCYTVGEEPTAIVNIMGSSGTLTDSFTAGTKAVQTNEAQGTVLRVYHCGETGGIGTAMTKADMQKARFANTLNDNKEGIWDYDADIESPTAYPYVLVDGKINKIEPIQISVSSIDETGKILTVDPVGEGPYYAKDSIKLKANVLDKDYLFNGWYQNETLISDYSQYEYTLRDQGPISIIAKYAAKPSIQFSVMNGAILGYGDGSGSVTINDADYNPVVFNGKATTGSSVTLKAKPELGSQFSYWRTMYDEKPISYDAEYTFNVSSQNSKEVYVAVFNKKAEDVFEVLFMNQGQVYQKQNIKNGETLQPVSNPTYIGKTFIGWVDEEGNDFALTTPITKNMTLVAKYEDNKPSYTVKVENGSISPQKESYTLDEKVTIIAEAAPENQHFIGWVKKYTSEESSVISYEETYSFYVNENVTYIAKYGQDEVEPQPIAGISQETTQIKVSGTGDTSVYGIKFIGNTIIPENYTGISTGFIYLISDADEPLTIPSDLNKDFIIGSDKVVVGSPMATVPFNGYQFTKGKGGLKAGQTIASRTYLTCLNSEGEEVTFYSDVAKATVKSN